MPDDRLSDPDLDPVEAVYDALDDDDPERALELARQGLAQAEGDDPILTFLAGVALLELDRPDEAERSLRAALAIDPDDAEFRARLAEALFRLCRFADAEHEARAAVAADPRLAHGHWVLGLAVERRGAYEEADAAFDRAVELDPEGFPRPGRVPRSRFEALLREAMDTLPNDFGRHLQHVVVTVEDLPSDSLLHDESPALDPELLGLFVGTALTEQSPIGPGGELPPRIYVFQRNLERWYGQDRDELVEQIGVTLRHELGHYLGLDEDEIEAAGHA